MGIEKTTNEINLKVTGDQQAKSKLGSLGSFIKQKLVISISDLTRAFKTVIGTIGKFIAASNKQEDAIKTLNQALKNTGNYSEEASKDLQKYASELQKVTRYGDENILSSMSLIASFGIEGQQLKDLTYATLDLAQAKGFNLRSAADLVAKSVGSSTNALTRYGVEITGAVGSTERAETAVKNIAKIFGGQAAAAAGTFAGKTKILSNNWGDFTEKLGGSIKKGIEPFVDLANVAVVAINKLTNAYGNSEKKHDGFSKAIKKLSEDNLNLINAGLLTEQNRLQQKINGMVLEQAAIIQTRNVQQEATAGNIQALSEEEVAYNKITKAINEQQTKLNDLNEKSRIIREEEISRIDKTAQDKIEKENYTAQQTIAMNNWINNAKSEANAQYADEEALRVQKLEKDKIESYKSAWKSLLELETSGSREYFDIQKNVAIADATMSGLQAMGKAAASAPFPFNLPAIAAETVRSASIIGGIQAQQFEQGGQFDRTPNVSTTTSGQTAIDNEAGLERVKVEPLGKTESSGGSPLQVTINLNGKTLAKELYPYIKAIDRRII